MNVLAGLLFAVVVNVHPQSFDRGGWALDPQFLDSVGSPYLLAHGLGVRVCDAKAVVTLPHAGRYRVWARTRNWAEGAPGRFRIAIDGKPLDRIFGAAQREWGWEDGGEVEVGETAEVRLQDLTGFDGRCAGLVFVDDGSTPVGALSASTLPVSETIVADFVVVGGGMPGTCAAIAAARRGLKVVLVQDRPVLGGNASSEIRVWACGEMRYPLVREVRNRFDARNSALALDDARRQRLVEDETNLCVRLSTRVFAAETVESRIIAVKALDLKKNRVVRFVAPLFCDATGDGWLGFYAGADWRMGREGRNETGEKMAPEKGDNLVNGASVMWTSREADSAVPFAAPWAEPYAQGQIAVKGAWDWEYGFRQDITTRGEEVRDRLLLAIYGAFSLAKKDPKNAHRVIDFCPYLLAKRESRRLLGDWILSEQDVLGARQFTDAIASGSWPIDLHLDDGKPGVDFIARAKHAQPGRYYIPYRSIYSRNVTNLFIVGRCFSCTHVGLGSPRVMNTLAQLGVAAGEAAAICRERSFSPREIYERGAVRILQERLGGGFPGVPDKETLGWTIVDDEDEGVRFGAGWEKRYNINGEQVGNVSHYPIAGVDKKAADETGDVIYPVPITKAGRYAVYGRIPWHNTYTPSIKAGSRTYFSLSGSGYSYQFDFDQGCEPGLWHKLGEFELAPGTELRLKGSPSYGTVVADGFGFKLEQ